MATETVKELEARLEEVRRDIAYYDGMFRGMVAGMAAGWTLSVALVLIFIWGNANF